MKANLLTLKVVAGAAALCLSGLSFAASTAAQNISFATTAMNWNSTKSFAKFDTSLGTLTSVTVSYTYNLNAASISVTNNGAASSTIDTVGIGRFGLYEGSIDAVTRINNVDTSNRIGTRDVNPSVIDPDNYPLHATVAAGATSVLNQAAFTGTGTITDTTGLSFYEAAGGGSGQLTLGGVSVVTNTTSGSFTTVFTPTSAAALSIVYNYTPTTSVPEPESYALMLAGLAAVGAVSRRRRIVG